MNGDNGRCIVILPSAYYVCEQARHLERERLAADIEPWWALPRSLVQITDSDGIRSIRLRRHIGLDHLCWIDDAIQHLLGHEAELQRGLPQGKVVVHRVMRDF